MASGMSEDQARDLIIQGFLNLDEQKIPEAVREEVLRMTAATREADGEADPRESWQSLFSALGQQR